VLNHFRIGNSGLSPPTLNAQPFVPACLSASKQVEQEGHGIADIEHFLIGEFPDPRAKPGFVSGLELVNDRNGRSGAAHNRLRPGSCLAVVKSLPFRHLTAEADEAVDPGAYTFQIRFSGTQLLLQQTGHNGGPLSCRDGFLEAAPDFVRNGKADFHRCSLVRF
jgi:hypothetical protein